MPEACVEHVWRLGALVVQGDGRLGQEYVCPRCPARQVVAPDEVPPGSPDLPG